MFIIIILTLLEMLLIHITLISIMISMIISNILIVSLIRYGHCYEYLSGGAMFSACSCLAGSNSSNHPHHRHLWTRHHHHLYHKTSQELRMLSSVTINCQVTMIVMNSAPTGTFSRLCRTPAGPCHTVLRQCTSTRAAVMIVPYGLAWPH